MVKEFTNYWSYDVCWKGIVVKPGQTVNDKGIKKENLEDNVLEVESDSVAKLKKELMKKKMNDLRMIGDEYGVKDTKKSELVQEIINKKIEEGEL